MAGWGWMGAAIGKIIGLSCGAGLAWIWIALHFPKSAQRHIQLSHIADLILFGLRYLPTGMLVVVVILTDRLMLANMVSLEATSLFSVASLFPMVLFIGIQGLMFGWQPWCFSRLSRHRAEDMRELAMGAAVYLLAAPLGALALTYLSRWLGPYVIAKEFLPAMDYVYPLMMAMVAQGFYLFSQSILHYYRRLEALSCLALMVMGINIALNYILIARMGTIGSAWATFTAYSAGFVVTAAIAWHTLSRRYLMNFTTGSVNV
jgi:Na+-driven multidrug efflux pump